MRLHQTKSICTEKETINEIKGQIVEWETVFSNHISDGLISYKSTVKKKSDQMAKSG